MKRSWGSTHATSLSVGGEDTHVTGSERRNRRHARTGVRRAARRLAVSCWDTTAWLVGLTVATWFRYDGDASLIDADGLAQVLLVAVAAH